MKDKMMIFPIVGLALLGIGMISLGWSFSTDSDVPIKIYAISFTSGITIGIIPLLVATVINYSKK